MSQTRKQFVRLNISCCITIALVLILFIAQPTVAIADEQQAQFFKLLNLKQLAETYVNLSKHHLSGESLERIHAKYDVGFAGYNAMLEAVIVCRSVNKRDLPNETFQRCNSAAIYSGVTGVESFMIAAEDELRLVNGGVPRKMSNIVITILTHVGIMSLVESIGDFCARVTCRYCDENEAWTDKLRTLKLETWNNVRSDVAANDSLELFPSMLVATLTTLYDNVASLYNKVEDVLTTDLMEVVKNVGEALAKQLEPTNSTPVPQFNPLNPDQS